MSHMPQYSLFFLNSKALSVTGHMTAQNRDYISQFLWKPGVAYDLKMANGM